MGFERFFLKSFRRVVAGLLDDVQFDNFLLEQAQAPTGEALGGREQVRAINFASAAPSKTRGRAEFGLYLRLSTASSLPRRADARRPIVSKLVSSATEIALSLHPSPASDTSAFKRIRAFVSDCAGCWPNRSSPPADRAPRRSTSPHTS